MIFRFFSNNRQCKEIILIDFCQAGWHLRYHREEAFTDKRCYPVFQRWVEENGCTFPHGLNDAFEELWAGIHHGHVTGEESQVRLNHFAEWMTLFSK